jgi:putative hemolysin
MAAEFLLLLVLLVVNGLFAMSEAAMISARQARLQERAESGNAGAAAALKIAAEPTRFLSTIQIGITLVGILSGAIGGSTLAERLQPLLAEIPALAPLAETLSVAIVVLVITYLSLVVGELVPKRLALNNAEGIAAAVARPMSILSRIVAPVVSLLSFSTRLLLLLLGSRPSDEPAVTEGEVKIILEEGARAGAFEIEEQLMAERVFRMDEWEVRALMTPYPEIIWLDLNASAEENIAVIVETLHDTYPVYREDMRHPVGLVSSKDLWAQLAAGKAFDLEAVLHPPVYIPETNSALQALNLFQQKERHLILVIDEHGSVVGTVTALDILETIVGDLPVTESPQANRRDDGSLLVDGMFNIDELEDMLETRFEEEAARRTYQTLGGFVMQHLDRIPRAGDSFTWGSFRFEVMDMDGLRVDKVLVTQAEPKTDVLSPGSSNPPDPD